MKGVISGLGILLLVAGIVWILQGLNIVRGSFMSGQAFWGAMGVLCVLAGAAMLYFGLIRRTT